MSVIGMNSSKWAHLSLLTALFALIAFILLLVTVLQCNFAKFVDTTDADVVREFGIWYYQTFTTVLTNEGTSAFWFCAAISSYFEQKAFIEEHRIEVIDASLTESLTVNNEVGTTV